jgi:outer membrane receptor protein involved in Fe transport
MHQIRRGPLRAAALLVFVTLLAAPSAARALEGLLLQPDGTPAAGYEVSVVGRSITVTTNAQGRFVISPDPRLPFQVVALGPQGEVSPVMDVTSLPESGGLELVLPATFRDSVTVTTGVAPGLEAPPAAATTLVGQQDLEQRRPQRLVEVLEAVPGTHSTGEGPTAVPSIRGLARGRTLVLLDGARVTTERRAGASAAFLDPFSLAGVEIARGPGSVTYGSDAFGGVINARSRYPEPGEQTLRYSLNKGFGGNDEESAAVEASTNLFGGAILGQFNIRRSGEAEAAEGERIDNSSYRDRGGALRYAVDTPAGRLRAGFSMADAYDTGSPAVDSNVTRSIYPRESSRRFNLDLSSGPVGTWDSLDVNLFLGTYGLVLDRDRLPTPTVTRQIESSDTDANDGSLRALAARPALGGRLQIGAEVVSRFGLESTTTRRLFDLAGDLTTTERTAAIEDAQRTATALFATWDRAVGGSTALSAGLRGDQVKSENTGGFFGGRSATHEALSGFAALTASLTPDLTGTLQVSRGFRDPTLSDRYFRGPSGRGFIIGNPDLEPETSLQYDASVRWRAGKGSVAVFGYLYQVENLIERFRPVSDFFFRNRGEAEVRGLELEVQQPLPWNLALELAATWAEGEIKDDNTPMDDIPTPGAFLTLRWAAAEGYAYTRFAAFQRDDEPGPTEEERPGYATVDLGVGYHVLDNLELRVIGKNLLDRRYREAADETAALAMGRSFMVGIVGRY